MKTFSLNKKMKFFFVFSALGSFFFHSGSVEDYGEKKGERKERS